jgi:hypothetical protein
MTAPNLRYQYEQPGPTSIIRRRRLHHREFPADYSSAGCSPAEPASASPAWPLYILVHPTCPHFSCLTPGVHSTYVQGIWLQTLEFAR